MQSLKNLFSGYQQLPPTQQQQQQSMQTMDPIVGSDHMMDSTDPLSRPDTNTNPFLITTTLNSINSPVLSTSQPNPTPQPELSSPTWFSFASQQTSQSVEQTQSKSWLSTFWVSPQQDEMNLQYDIESGQTAAQAVHQTNGKLSSLEGSEQNFSIFQKAALSVYRKFSPLMQHLPSIPELTYPQRLLACSMFAIAGLFLFITALISLPQIFLGGASKFAYSFTVANIFFVVASLFVMAPSSHFSPHRRFTTILYIGSIFLTLITCSYLPYMIFVLPILLVQIIAMVFHMLSFFSSAVNVEFNLGQQILTSIFRQAI